MDNPAEEYEYQVLFMVEGNMSVMAFSEEHARRQAVDALECVDCMDAEQFEVEGCTVRVTARVTDDAHEKIDGSPQCVEFAS